jgi:predicted secreted Zn-dependent protease
MAGRAIPSAVRVERSSDTYAITGSRREHLREAMGLLGPRRGERTFPAYTDWTIDWEHGDDAGADGHRPAAPRVLVRIACTLPRWRAPSSAPPELVEAFARYLAHAAEHEEGHAARAVDAACRVYEALASQAPRATTEEMARLARARVELVLAEARARDAVYDDEDAASL